MSTPEEKTMAFSEAYAIWMRMAREVKIALRKTCLEEDLHELKRGIWNKHDSVSECFESIQLNCTATEVMGQKMEACIIITTELCDLVDRSLKAVVEKRHKDEREMRPVAEMEMVGDLGRESISTRNTTGQEMVGEMAPGSTPIDDVTGEENQEYVNQITVREVPTPSSSDLPTVSEPENNMHVSQSPTVQLFDDIIQKEEIDVKDDDKVKDCSEQSQEQESDSVTPEASETNGSLVSRAAPVKRKLKQKKKVKRKKKVVERKLEHKEREKRPVETPWFK